MGNLVVKDNALIEASHRLNEVEQRLILLAILKIRESGDQVEAVKDKELEIHADDYIRNFNVERNAAYKALKTAVIGLYRAEWGYKYVNNRGHVVVRYERFTQSAEYIETEATVKFTFANAIIPMLVELERNFTSYEIEQISHLSSRYAMRLYEILMKNYDKKSGKGWLEISLEELRWRFKLLDHEYSLMSNFKKFVLDLSVRQINQNTDINVSYEQQKRGRQIVGFKFQCLVKKQLINKKNKKFSTEERDISTIDMFDNLTDAERGIIASKNAYADSINANELHRQNLITHGLRAYRELQKDKSQKKEKIQLSKVQKQNNDEKIRITALETYEKLLNADNLVKEKFAHDNKQIFTATSERYYYQNKDFDNLIISLKHKFENVTLFKSLNLSMLES